MSTRAQFYCVVVFVVDPLLICSNIYLFFLICFVLFFVCCFGFGFKFSKISSAIFIFFYCLFVFTGPLLNEDMSVDCMPYKQYEDLTFSLSGKELGWRPHTHLFIN